MEHRQCGEHVTVRHSDFHFTLSEYFSHNDLDATPTSVICPTFHYPDTAISSRLPAEPPVYPGHLTSNATNVPFCQLEGRGSTTRTFTTMCRPLPGVGRLSTQLGAQTGNGCVGEGIFAAPSTTYTTRQVMATSGPDGQDGYHPRSLSRKQDSNERVGRLPPLRRICSRELCQRQEPNGAKPSMSGSPATRPTVRNRIDTT